MKISKQRLLEIIKEEIQLEQGEQGTENIDVKALGQFKAKFLQLSKEISNVKGLDAKEMTLIWNLVTDLIKFAAGSSAGPVLKQIDAIVGKKTGIEE
jgi:hypothetical protein